MLDQDKMRKFLKNKYVLMGILIIILAGLSFTLYQYYHQDFGIQEITPAEEDDFSVKYYLYFDEEADVEEKPLMLHPFHAGLENDDMESEAGDDGAEAYQAARSIHGLADEIEAALLVPALDLERLEHDTGDAPGTRDIIDRYDRSFSELEAVIADAASRLEERGMEMKDDIYLFGFGYSSLFASRWMLNNPHKIERAALGSPGEWPAVPQREYRGQKLEFPLGMSGVSSEQDEIDLLSDVSVLIFRGEEDRISFLSDRRIFTDMQEDLLQEMGGSGYDEMLDLAVELYEDSPIQLRYEEYPDVDHRFNLEMHDDVIEFFRDN